MKINNRTEPRKRYPDGSYSMYAVQVLTVTSPTAKVMELNAVEFDGGPDPRAIEIRRYKPGARSSREEYEGTVSRWYVGLTVNQMARLRRLFNL